LRKQHPDPLFTVTEENITPDLKHENAFVASMDFRFLVDKWCLLSLVGPTYSSFPEEKSTQQSSHEP
jgi:hypothetical protein